MRLAVHQATTHMNPTMTKPGNVPAMNRSLTLTLTVMPYSTNAMLGGMMIPVTPPAATVAAAKAGG